MQMLVLGSAGMLGRALARVHAEEHGHSLTGYDRSGCDITDEARVRAVLRDAAAESVFLCAAWTDVDGAEANREAALRVNGEGAGIVARSCAARGAALIYLSTDYVFDGEKADPYREDDPPAPLNAYGESKRLGEERVRESGCGFLIVRTSWLFGPHGKHFVDAILTKARAGVPLRVVDDQVGAPTYTVDLARALFTLAEQGARGVVNVTNRGWCSWSEFARRIVAQAGPVVPVEPIRSEELHRPARRPRSSRLDDSRLRSLGVPMPTWEDALGRYLDEVGSGRSR
jgi:dTDP-4-dehydrorhamnose reductase